jgi:hypothetical protein
LLEQAKYQLGLELKYNNMHIDRVVDQNLLNPALMAKVAWLSLLTGDDAYSAERDVTMAEYTRQVEILIRSPIWVDRDQDGIEDSAEVEDHAQMGMYERGL